MQKKYLTNSNAIHDKIQNKNSNNKTPRETSNREQFHQLDLKNLSKP